MQLFYSKLIQNQEIILEAEEKIHCTQVLRKKVEDEIYVVDGIGNLYKTRILSIQKHTCVCSIIETTPHFGNHPYFLRMCVAPTKNIDRFEFFVEKAVELGVNEIIPIISENSERKIIKPERIEKIIVSAMKQSYKSSKPILHDIITAKALFAQQFKGIQCIAHCYESEKTSIAKLLQTPQPITICIGPEGDFSEKEVALARTNNWQEITLGTSRLRTETAGIAAVHSVYEKFV